MNPLLFADVPDPTDFPLSHIAPGLRELDTSLRCNICGEVYDGPVMLNCGHSFCSHCIRGSLVEKQECPKCRKTAMEIHIRPNTIVEDIVSYWKLSRPYILRLIKDNDAHKRETIPITPKAKKRKITPETERALSSTNSSASPLKAKKVKKNSSELFTTIPTSDAEEDELQPPPLNGNNPRPEDLVDCPLCNKKVKFQSINQHMDKGCKDIPPISVNSTSANDWRKLMSRSSKGKQKDTGHDDDDNYPLPKASYDTLKDKKIKEMLSEYGLPTTGDRPQWIKRHQQWIILYNSNLDKSGHNRKSKETLKKDLRRWEEENSKKKKATVKDVVAHEKQYQGEFARLIEVARPRNIKAGDSISSQNSFPSGKSQQPERSHPIPPEEDAIVVDSEEEEELSLIQRV